MVVRDVFSDWKFWVSLILDFLGAGFFFIFPQASDIFTAPANFIWIKFFLGGSTVLAGIGAVEEILPATDIIPSCLIAYGLYRVRK